MSGMCGIHQGHDPTCSVCALTTDKPNGLREFELRGAANGDFYDWVEVISGPDLLEGGRVRVVEKSALDQSEARLAKAKDIIETCFYSVCDIGMGLEAKYKNGDVPLDNQIAAERLLTVRDLLERTLAELEIKPWQTSPHAHR